MVSKKDYERAIATAKKLNRNKKVIACVLFDSAMDNLKTARDLDICLITRGMDSEEKAGIALGFGKPTDVSFMDSMPNNIALNVFRRCEPIIINDSDEYERVWRMVVHEHMMHHGMRERIFKGVRRWMTSTTP